MNVRFGKKLNLQPLQLQVNEHGLIMLNILLAPVGGLFALYFTGVHFSVSSGVGFLALFGVRFYHRQNAGAFGGRISKAKAFWLPFAIFFSSASASLSSDAATSSMMRARASRSRASMTTRDSTRGVCAGFGGSLK